MKNAAIISFFVTLSLILFLLGTVLYLGNYFDNVLNLTPFNKIPKTESQPIAKEESKKSIIDDTKTSNCEGLTEAECFAKLTECNGKPAITIPYQTRLEIEAPIATVLPNAKLFKIVKLLGGGDSSSDPYVELGNKYCNLNDENAKILFGPITSPEMALKYYMFLRQQIGGSFEQEEKYILNSQIYDSPEILFNTGTCQNSFKNVMNNRITKTTISDKGFEIKLIKFTYIGIRQFTETNVTVLHDGSIIEEKPSVLLDCGPGSLF